MLKKITKIGASALFSLVLSTVQAQMSFAPKVDYTTGSDPYSVAIGDLNGDGRPDLAVANNSSNTVSVFTSTGSGTFGAKVDYNTGNSPTSVAIGDLNGDGKPDLVVANRSSFSVSVLTNIGSGRFGAKVDYTTGNGPISVAIGDLNGDGRPDLAVANSSSNTVSVLTSTGSGTFGAKVDYSIGLNTSPNSVAIGDLNGDGRLDLAVANFNGNTVSVLTSTGSGTFGTKMDYNVGAGAKPISVAIGDLNGDGRLDLAVANYQSNTVSVLTNTGIGTYSAKVDYPTGDFPRSVAIGDLNGDGRPDLAVANSFDGPGGNSVSVLTNTGIGTFGAKLDFTTGSNPLSVAIGDLNGDGRPDLAVANAASTDLSVLLNTSVFPPKPFITEWDLSKISYPNEQRNDVISFGVGTTTGVVSYQWETIPATISGTGTFTGTVASITGLPADAKIRLSIDPQNFNRFYTWYFNPETGEERIFDSPRKLINVAQWGDVAWSDMFGAFYECANMEMTATDVPNLSGVTDMGYMFYEARIFNGSIGGWNVSNVKNMFSTFQYARAFNQPIGNWNTSNVEDMTAMFINAEAFNQPLSNWNTAKVAQMGQMFSDAYAFNQPIGNWNIGQVVRMENMFYNATAFDQSLGGWGAILNPSVTLTGLLDNTPLSVANYDATLQGFASGTVTGRNLRAFGVKYCNKATRDVLTGTGRNWTISDGGGLTPTSFITQPVSVATCSGLSAIFNVSATGITPLTYLWNTGATTTSINATTPQDFQVTVTGGCGVAVSSIAGFSIITVPSIISQPLSVTTCAGISVPFIVSVTGNILSYAWSNGLSTSNEMMTSTAGTNYQVTVSGICGRAVSNPFALLNTVCGSSTITSSVIVFLNTIPGTFTGTSGNLTWPTIAGAATYCIRYSKTSNFSTTVVTVCGLTAANYLFVLSTAGLRTEATDETIYYQVAAVDANGNMSQWSATQSFVLRTDQTTAVNLPTYQSTSFSVYPNPTSNGEWRIENAEVGATMYVFNAQGTIVYTQTIVTISTEVATKLSSGIYLVKVSTQMVKLVVE